MIKGYTVGTFDLLHVGHIRFLRACREQCDSLIVGINTDDIVLNILGKKKPIIPEKHRVEMVQALEDVDYAWLAYILDKTDAWEELQFDKLFTGDDWLDTNHWRAIEKQFENLAVEIVYLPYTQGISSSMIRQSCGVKMNKIPE